MAYENILKRTGRNRGRNKQIVSIPQGGFRGVNYVDSPTVMQAHQLPFAQNVDLGSPIGDISKCPGYEALFDSLGSGRMGVHAWEHPDGDKLVGYWSNYLYLLTGDSGAISKSSQEDWEAGAGTDIDTTTSPGDVALEVSGTDFSETDTLTADFNGTHDNTADGGDKVVLDIAETSGAAKYYIQNVAAGYDPATEQGDWDTTAGYGLKKLSKDKYGAIATEGGDSSSFAAGTDSLIIKAVTDPLVSARAIAGTLRWCLGVKENHTDNNMVYHIHAWVTQGDSSTVRGTLLDDYVGSSEFPTTAAGKLIAAQTLTSVNAQVGDRIVIEIGTYAGGAGDYYGTIWYGGTGNDLTDGGDETTLTGWFEFSQDPADQYETEGTYTHPAQDISGIGTTKGVTIAYNKTTPAGTSVTVETRTSTNGGSSYGAWTARASGDTVVASGVDVSGYRVQWRATLATTDVTATPSLDDVTLAGDSGYTTFGSIIIGDMDMGNTPTTAIITFTKTTPAGTSIACLVRGSSDGTVYGDWQTIAASGDAIPLLRYPEVKFELTGTVDATPTLSDFLISYSNSYTKPNQLDISPLGRTDDKLTGNRVSMQDYEDRCYGADGLRPFVLYVEDDTETTGTAQASTELILNNEFETYTGTIDDDTADTFGDWTGYSTGTGRIEAVTGDGATGVAMLATQTAATAAGESRGAQQARNLTDMGLMVGDVISVAVKYKMSAQTGAVVRANLLFRDSGGGTISTSSIISDEASVKGSYIVAKLENITIPANTVSIRFQAYIRSSAAYSGQTNQLWVEYISCVKADVITLAAAASAVDDFYNNALITLTDGTGEGQVRFISDYDGATKLATVSEAWDTAPDATTDYSIGSAVKVRNAGVDEPETACSAAAGAATGLTGTFYYKVTFVNKEGYESNPSAASSAVTVSNQKIDVSSIPTGDSTIASRKLYRTKNGGSVYYYVTTIADNTTATYTDSTADSSLTTLMDDNNNIPPETCSLVYSFNTYMFYASNDELWFSKVGYPESCPNITGDINMNMMPSAIRDIKSNPMALVVQGDNFINPITTSSGFVFDSDPLVDTTTMRSIDKNGCFSAWASDICIDPQMRSVLTFPTNTGVRVLMPGLQEESIESVPLSRNVQPYFDRSVNRTNMAGIFFDSRYYISFEHHDPEASENQFLTFCYDFRTSEWYGPWTYGASCYAISGNVLYAGDPEAGIIRQMNTGSSFAGADIEMIADLPVISPKGENMVYKFLRFMLMVSAESDTSDLVVKPKVDSREVTVTPGTLTDTFVGLARPGHDTIRSRKFRIPLAKGSTLSYRIEDTGTNPISIQKVISEAEILPLKR